jgi:nucleosome binding factor SPN SPT16 subunit
VLDQFSTNEFFPSLKKSFGYGIGMNLKEEKLALKTDSQVKIENGMTFCLRVIVTDFQPDKEKHRNCVCIGDTVLVLKDSTEVLTRNVSKMYQDISYFLDDEEPQQNDKTAESTTQVKKPAQPVERVKESVILSGRTRENNKNQSKDLNRE